MVQSFGQECKYRAPILDALDALLIEYSATRTILAVSAVITAFQMLTFGNTSGAFVDHSQISPRSCCQV